MNQYIIRISGTPADVINQIKTLQTIFGKGATLSDVAAVAKYSKVLQAEKKQFEKDGKRK